MFFTRSACQQLVRKTSDLKVLALKAQSVGAGKAGKMRVTASTGVCHDPIWVFVMIRYTSRAQLSVCHDELSKADLVPLCKLQLV